MKTHIRNLNETTMSFEEVIQALNKAFGLDINDSYSAIVSCGTGLTHSHLTLDAGAVNPEVRLKWTTALAPAKSAIQLIGEEMDLHAQCACVQREAKEPKGGVLLDPDIVLGSVDPGHPDYPYLGRPRLDQLPKQYSAEKWESMADTYASLDQSDDAIRCRKRAEEVRKNASAPVGGKALYGKDPVWTALYDLLTQNLAPEVRKSLENDPPGYYRELMFTESPTGMSPGVWRLGEWSAEWFADRLYQWAQGLTEDKPIKPRVAALVGNKGLSDAMNLIDFWQWQGRVGRDSEGPNPYKAGDDAYFCWMKGWVCRDLERCLSMLDSKYSLPALQARPADYVAANRQYRNLSELSQQQITDTRPAVIDKQLIDKLTAPAEVPVAPPQGLSPANWDIFFKTFPEISQDELKVKDHYSTHLMMSDSCNALMNAAREDGGNAALSLKGVYYPGDAPEIGSIWVHTKTAQNYIIRAILWDCETDRRYVSYEPWDDEMPKIITPTTGPFTVDEFVRPLNHGAKSFFYPGRFVKVRDPLPPKEKERPAAGEEPKYVGHMRRLIQAGNEFEKATNTGKWADAIRKWKTVAQDAIRYLGSSFKE